uniref:Uncharacterized protein n=1 Tax=Molossus molossus TaxID=27622 RepID=A0A7J8F9F7_MOLMO|nr:hypothetical protein HJG59_008624 [Molossus molossus]
MAPLEDQRPAPQQGRLPVPPRGPRGSEEDATGPDCGSLSFPRAVDYCASSLQGSSGLREGGSAGPSSSGPGGWPGLAEGPRAPAPRVQVGPCPPSRLFGARRWDRCRPAVFIGWYLWVLSPACPGKPDSGLRGSEGPGAGACGTQ